MIIGGKILVYIYYIKSLKTILLNPFDKNKDIGNLDSEEEITVLSANTLTKEDTEYIEKESFSQIDNSVNLWIQEKRYYLRLFAATFAFFIMYFFLSLVIRDPIPLLDEMLGSAIFAILAWNFFAKRDKKSAIANKNKLEIKRHVSTSNNIEIDLIKKLENYLYEINSLDNLDIADALTLVEGSLEDIDLTENDKIYFDELLKLLKIELFKKTTFKSLYSKVIKVRENGEKDEALSSRLIEFGKSNKFDLLLLALLVKLENK